ncbi:putative feruloyl esterase-like protein 2 [Colletotrichum chlorophyti]|uniref:Carboxylic ester hydrolase n=1 Tax=Colletotrichum chlorophyti TaxID=708187 RepID=A0A1Q8RZW4_9PEZI|nr:putative feruloyl esterase-like protein 2 [Colletotrichum chlorophyti]
MANPLLHLLPPACSGELGQQKPLTCTNEAANILGSPLNPKPCVESTFSTPSLLGAEFLALEAALVQHFSVPIPSGWRFSQPSTDVHDASFCNITVSYTHPGHDDTIKVETWLPVDNWNGRLQAIGGGGWRAGRFNLTYTGMAGAVADGYATVSTDAGLGDAVDPMSWALVSPGNSNLYALQDLGSVSLNDEAIISKHLIESYYGRKPSYSYWNGCSQGGRQGATLAQRYPTAYDGIIAAAPAINWAGVLLSTLWPKVYMDVTGQYPRSCELQQLTSLAVAVCDTLDGVEDGIISDTVSCKEKFDPFSHVGSVFYCSSTGSSAKISRAAASVAQAMWKGPVTAEDGPTYLYGLEIGTDLTRGAPTNCTRKGICTGLPNTNVQLLLGYFIEKNPDINSTQISFKHLARAYRSFRQQFDSFLASDDPDLSEFRDAGGKMITFHGLADPTVPTTNSLNYFKKVLELQPDAHDFYRYFPVPGLGHCWGGPGGQPDALFDQLRSWVENGTAPDSSLVTITKPDKTTQEQLLCPYPKRAVFKADKVGELGWSCAT